MISFYISRAITLKHLIIFLGIFSNSNLASAQIDSSHTPKIAEIKRLPDDELAEKKEGLYFTGVPDFSADPLNGFGYGLEGTLFFNGKKSDPLFAYTPYRQKLDIALFNTTKNARELSLKLDIPYIGNTPWRLRTEIILETNPNLVYFGNTSKTLEGLSFFENGDSSARYIQNGSYSDYEKSLVNNRAHYNDFIKKESVINISLERSLMEGKARWLIGYEFAKFNNSTFAISGNLVKQSKLLEDVNKNGVLGLGDGHMSMVQFGLVYDTRNSETDPSNGYFAEITHETSLKIIGSGFDFSKTFAQIRGYHQILNKHFKKQVFAWRAGAGVTSGNAPFFEYADEWSSEGSIEGLGGTNTLRGFKQSRFMAPIMNFNNLELRSQFWSGKAFNQYLAMSAVPFFDFGGCWDNFSKLNTSNFRYNSGLGLRIAWNVNTILRFDYAVSKEDNQFFFQMNHTF